MAQRRQHQKKSQLRNRRRAAKPAAAKKEAAPAKAEPVDTQSILAAARKGAKPGPMTKAEAAVESVAGCSGREEGQGERSDRRAADAGEAGLRKARRGEGEQGTSCGTTRVSVRHVGAGGRIYCTCGDGCRLDTRHRAIHVPERAARAAEPVQVGSPDKFPPGQVEERFKAQFGVWIVNAEYNGQQQIFALKTVCTHLGCTPNWLEAEQKFKCPCHGSGFYKDGINFEGPAPRPLERYAIGIGSDGQIEVDKSRTFQEEMGAWDDPSCFIPV